MINVTNQWILTFKEHKNCQMYYRLLETDNPVYTDCAFKPKYTRPIHADNYNMSAAYCLGRSISLWLV